MRYVSLGRTQLLDFCNKVSNRHTGTYPRARSSPARGDCPLERCHARCAFNAALFFLFGMQRSFEPMRRSELRDNPRHPGSRPGPLQPEKPKPPRTTPFKWARRTWDTRRSKERSEGEWEISCETNPKLTWLAPVQSLLDCSFAPLLSPVMRARRDGSPFTCSYTFASSAEAFVPLRPREGT